VTPGETLGTLYNIRVGSNETKQHTHRGGAPARALRWRCACLRCARLRLPCSRCVYLLCVRLLCMLGAWYHCAATVRSARKTCVYYVSRRRQTEMQRLCRCCYNAPAHATGASEYALSCHCSLQSNLSRGRGMLHRPHERSAKLPLRRPAIVAPPTYTGLCASRITRRPPVALCRVWSNIVASFKDLERHLRSGKHAAKRGRSLGSLRMEPLQGVDHRLNGAKRGRLQDDLERRCDRTPLVHANRYRKKRLSVQGTKASNTSRSPQ